MISVHGKQDDYAIMKQVQQIKLRYRDMAIDKLDANADFSQLRSGETLFLVSHGERLTGELRDIPRTDLLAWLLHGTKGVPPDFGGIVICACYTGEDSAPGRNDSLAHDIAQGLRGRVTPDTTVKGANGYSFGTPEFGQSGLSSVLRQQLRCFYTLTDNAISQMAADWPSVHPTHTGGVLATEWKIQVQTDKTIQENLNTKNVKPADVANQMTGFKLLAKQIEARLRVSIAMIPGKSVAEVAANLIATTTDSSVETWNAAIKDQYELYAKYYLWAPAQEAFTVFRVP